MADPRPSRIVPILLIVVLIVAAGTAAGLVYEHNRPTAGATPFAVQLGDNVTVNYIGLYASGPQEGRVFDTTFHAVETDNVTYPKSLEFHACGLPVNCTPVGFHVGPSAPSGGYTVDGQTFYPPVTGFWQGLVGLTGNQTRWITIPPNLGYGSMNQSCLETVPLSFAQPVVVLVPLRGFPALYPGVSPTPGTEFTDPNYGWTDLILSTNTTTVVVENLPTVGAAAHQDGLPVLVTNISTTTISLQYELNPLNFGSLLGTFPAAKKCGSESFLHFLVLGVDLGTGTFTENWNPEVVGPTLLFSVTVVNIYPA